MKTKIKTQFGYLYLPDERIAENYSTLYKETNQKKNIDIITVTSGDAKRLYRTVTPYGISYTDHYDRVLASKRAVIKLNAGNPERKINFLEIS